MTELLKVDIAGIQTTVSVADASILLNSDNDFPSDFIINTTQDLSGSSREVFVHFKNDLDFSSFVKTFDCGEGWTMYRKDNLRCAVLHPEGFSEPFWSCVFDPQEKTAEVFCSELMLIPESESTTLKNPFRYPLDMILMMYWVALEKGVIIHASGVVKNGKGFLFSGKSGAGKSTVSRLFSDSGTEVLSDDRIVIRENGDKFDIYGTPWLGEGEFSKNNNAPLKSIFFLKKCVNNSVRKLSQIEALEKIMHVLSIPWHEKEMVPESLDFCGKLLEEIPAYELSFSLGENAAASIAEMIDSI